MKFEPFGAILFTAMLGATGVASANAETIPMLAATLSGGSIAGALSVLKSRRKRANSTDTALWAYIAMIGGMGLAFFGAPVLAHAPLGTWGGVEREMPWAPPIAFVLAIGGAPIIEKLGAGWLVDLLPEWLGGKKKGGE